MRQPIWSLTLSGTQVQAEKSLKRLLGVVSKLRVRKKLPPGLEVEIRVVGTQQMQTLNQKYRKKNRPTDVLSFPNPEPFYSLGQIGQLVVCLPVARAQAKEIGHSVGVELDILITHGILHLLGYDHEKNPKEAQLMARMERKILQKHKGLIERGFLG